MPPTALTTLILGGCRSGKSRLALRLAEKLKPSRRGFIATCVPQDDEMLARVQHHQQERGPDWQTRLIPLELAHGIREAAADMDVLVVDCLTLWLSNLLLNDDSAASPERSIGELLAVLRQPPCRIVLVANEVGLGIAPENALARRFRDEAGRLNQQVAEVVQQVIWSVAGIPLVVKPELMLWHPEAP